MKNYKEDVHLIISGSRTFIGEATSPSDIVHDRTDLEIELVKYIEEACAEAIERYINDGDRT